MLFSHGRVCGIEGVVAHICPLFEFAAVLASGGLKEGSMRWNSDNRTGWDNAASVLTRRVTISEAPLGL